MHGAVLLLSQSFRGSVVNETGELYLYVCIVALPCTFFTASDRFALPCKRTGEIVFCLFIVIKVIMAAISN